MKSNNKKVEAHFMGGYVEVEFEKLYMNCAHRRKGIIRSVVNSPLFPFNYGEEVLVYASYNKRDKMDYYIVMTKIDIDRRIYEPMNKQALAYIKKLRSMPLKDATMQLFTDESMTKEDVIYFMEGNDEAATNGLCSHGKIYKNLDMYLIENVGMLGYRFDVLVRSQVPIDLMTFQYI